MLVEAPKRATKFAANEQYTKIVLELTGLPKLTQSLSIFTGVLSGVTEALVVSSFELVKVRMQDRAQATKYKSTWDCMALILREEGPLAFFRGLEATIWRHAAWNGAYFGIIHAVRDVIARIKLQSRTSILSPDGNTVQSDIGIPDERVMRRTKKSSLVENFVAGAIGGTFATALNTPFDVAKTLIQNSSPGGPRYMGSYAWPVMREVVKRDGFRALYRGFTPKVVRLGPGGGILLVVFDYVSRLLRDNLMDSHHAD